MHANRFNPPDLMIHDALLHEANNLLAMLLHNLTEGGSSNPLCQYFGPMRWDILLAFRTDKQTLFCGV